MLPLVSAPAYAPEPEWRLNHERSVQSNGVTAHWCKRPAPSSAPVLAKGGGDRLGDRRVVRSAPNRFVPVLNPSSALARRRRVAVLG